MSDVAIRVENLGKMYRIGAREKSLTTLRERLQNLVLSPFGYLRTTLRGPTEEETLWALKDVSFEVKHGEVLGVIGRNGAGKSTLLKILSRITEPTTGYADVYGRVGSLLEVGTGFHPELTGRENVYMNGAILGMRRAEIDRKFDEIVDFSGVDKFIDTPVKRYSSGMYVRLAFAVAAHLEPEILVIDEVLAVGDAQFQKKCLGKMGAVAQEGRTVLFVSHNMGMIRSLCDRAILLSTGTSVADGTPVSVISTYLDSFEERTNSSLFVAEPDPRQQLQILEVSVKDSKGDVCTQFDIADTIIIDIQYVVRDVLVGSALSLKIVRNGTILCTSFDTDDMQQLLDVREPGRYRFQAVVSPMILKPGRYTVNVGAGILNQSRLDYNEGAVFFDIDALSMGDSLKSFASKRDGLIVAPMNWKDVSRDD